MRRANIDPGGKSKGVAWAVLDDTVIMDWGRWFPEEPFRLGMPFNLLRSADMTVVEKPQVYLQRKAKGDPNDLIDIMAQGAELAGRIGAPVQYYTPREWKGSTPKDICHGRMRDFYQAQGDAESLAQLDDIGRVIKNVKLREDVLDACALGLWAARKGLQP